MTQEALNDWKTWRHEQRRQLLEKRRTLSSATRQDLTRGAIANLDRVLSERSLDTLGIYWPIKREINLLEWAANLSRQRNIALALPVVTAPHTPLEYWRWRPADPMTRGAWNIPVPAARTVVDPDVVIAPLVGFFGCWRLVYGGG
jgi:5,10-methenyltetrahydrofolate synthetase